MYVMSVTLNWAHSKPTESVKQWAPRSGAHCLTLSVIVTLNLFQPTSQPWPATLTASPKPKCGPDVPPPPCYKTWPTTKPETPHVSSNLSSNTEWDKFDSRVWLGLSLQLHSLPSLLIGQQQGSAVSLGRPTVTHLLSSCFTGTITKCSAWIKDSTMCLYRWEMCVCGDKRQWTCRL